MLILDTGVLSLVIHPTADQESKECNDWFINSISQGLTITSSEMSDYELRRELIRGRKTKSLRKLNDLTSRIGCIPINTSMMKKAAELWAFARQTGQATAHDKELDADVILSAQAIILGFKGKSPVIVTTNVKHIARYTPALHWKQTLLDNCINAVSNL